MQALLRASEIDFSVSGSIFDEGRQAVLGGNLRRRCTI